jgi:acetoin utilization deacetylase AcuC-like enzyme
MSPRTGFFLHEAGPLHDTGWGHPEHQGRLRTLASVVGKDLLVLHGHVEPLGGRLATREELERVHPPSVLDAIEARSQEAALTGRVLPFAEDTPVSGATWEAVLGSAGSAVEAVEAVADGRLRNAFVATRPPGHHASADRAMGFCLVNHVAVAARHLLATGRAQRVAILDWDVHHGNGTQALFEADPQVFFLSIHQWPLYPGTGGAEERGVGEGEGTVLNLPLPPGTTGKDFIEAFRLGVAEAARVFSPDFLLISAGYDALAGDPLGGMELEPNDYHALTRIAMDWADSGAGGRVVALLEGGYEPRRTGQGVVATLRALAGEPPP